jgi:hypothetical protein
MSRRRALTIAVALVVLFACLNIALGMFWLPAIPSHCGDGTFQDLSRRAGPFAMPGYGIRRPQQAGEQRMPLDPLAGRDAQDRRNATDQQDLLLFRCAPPVPEVQRAVQMRGENRE